LSYASRLPENRAAEGFAHGVSRYKFLLPLEKYSTAAGLAQNAEAMRARRAL